MTDKEIYEKRLVQAAMQHYGGSFAENLGKALYCADAKNTRKIKATWPDLWEQYLDMGRLDQG